MTRKNNICLIGNIAPHYRLPIFKLMEERIGCDFYFGDRMKFKIKTIAPNDLRCFKKTLHNVFFGNFYWQRGSIPLMLRPYKYYILDGEPYCLSSWLQLLIAKVLRKNTISWTHGWYGREGVIKRIIKRAYYHMFSSLMVYSEYAIALMERQGFHKDRLFCIANSLDSDKEKEIRTHLHHTRIYSSHFQNDNPAIIYCGRIQKGKKLEMIIDAIKQMKQEGIMVNVVFVGKDIDDINIELYAANRGVASQVWMFGPCYDDAILGELFYNAHVCVSPGNVGLTAIHALSFGCPVVTHDNFSQQMPEFEAICPGKTGDFFKQDNLSSLVKMIEYWTTKDMSQRENTRQAAYAEIDRKWNIHYQLEIINRIVYDD